VPGAPGPGASGADVDGRAWTIAGGGYVATFGFVAGPAPFAGCLTCRSLTHFGDELLTGPGAPLVLPWMGRLSSTQFVVGGTPVDLNDVDGVTLDELGRPLHGLSVDADRWEVSVVDEVLHAVARLPASAGFPVATRVAVTATVAAEGMRVRTTVGSDGLDVVPVAVGWHPYLRAPGPGTQVMAQPKPAPNRRATSSPSLRTHATIPDSARQWASNTGSTTVAGLTAASAPVGSRSSSRHEVVKGRSTSTPGPGARR